MNLILSKGISKVVFNFTNEYFFKNFDLTNEFPKNSCYFDEFIIHQEGFKFIFLKTKFKTLPNSPGHGKSRPGDFCLHEKKPIKD